jgi:hypothetical protein
LTPPLELVIDGAVPASAGGAGSGGKLSDMAIVPGLSDL